MIEEYHDFKRMVESMRALIARKQSLVDILSNGEMPHKLKIFKI